MSPAREPRPTRSGPLPNRPEPSRPSGSPVLSLGKTLADVAVGEELPPLDIPITPTLIVAGAIASRDFQDVHHDVALAKERGSPDIFMNILTTNGLVGRFVTDWAGPNALISKVAIRLGAPNYPGDTMHLTGSVTAIADDGTIEVEIVGANRIGNHVTGTVTFTLPPTNTRRGIADE